MTLFRIDVSRETGEVMLWIEARRGLRPIIGWPNMNGLREFAEMLLDIYHHRNKETDRVREVSDSIIKQALGNDLNFLEEEPSE